ncbi:uncharacterized [Tachysurus ichikawai]
MSMSSHYFRSGADLDLKGCWILVAPSGVKGLRVSFRAPARWGRLASPGNVIPACEVACEWQGLPLEGKMKCKSSPVTSQTRWTRFCYGKIAVRAGRVLYKLPWPGPMWLFSSLPQASE